MADPYTPLFDEGVDPFDPANPFVLKKTLGPRKPVPLGGQNAPVPPVDSGERDRQFARDLLQAAQAQGPTEQENTAMQQYAQKRDEQAKRDFMLGTAMSMGGSTFAPMGAQVLKQALAAQSPEKIGGGIVQGGQFITDPEVTSQRRAQRLEAQAKIYESMAANAATVAQREQAAQLAAQTRALIGGIAQGNQQTNQNFKTWHEEDNLRSHFDTVTKNTRDVLNEARVVATIPTTGRLSPVQIQSLIVLLNKFQDPGSVVREGEFNRVAQAQGILQRLGNLPAQISRGVPIPPALVKDVQNVISLYTQAAENTMRASASDYFKLARQRGLDPTQVVTDHRWHPVDAQAQPGRGIDVGARLNAGAPAPAPGAVQVDY